MSDEIKEKERHVEFLKAANEEKGEELSLEQKKASIREAKQMYGKDWKKMIGGAVSAAGKMRVNAETMQNLHSLGMGGDRLRDLNDPRSMGR